MAANGDSKLSWACRTIGLQAVECGMGDGGELEGAAAALT